MLLNDIVRYSIEITEVPNRDLAIRLFQDLIDTIGYKSWCLFHEPKPTEDPTQLVIAANWEPRWAQRYLERKYIAVDPVLKYLLRTNRTYSWKQATASYQDHQHFRRMQKAMHDARAHGLAAGHVFPIFGRSGLIGATTMGGPDEIELSPIEIMLLETATRATYFRLLAFEGDRYARKTGEGKDIVLTQRELQALSNMAEGKTSPEIAEILKVAPTTVDWYGASVQEKLDAKNRINAVALAIRQGLIP